MLLWCLCTVCSVSWSEMLSFPLLHFITPACCSNLMSQLSGWLDCRLMAVYPLLCTDQLCCCYHNGQQSTRWWVYQVLCLWAGMIPWTNCPSLPSYACQRASNTSSGWRSNSIWNALKLSLLFLLPLSEQYSICWGNTCDVKSIIPFIELWADQLKLINGNW